MSRNLLALLSGILFGLGLSISQMINPQKVLGFLDITGNWDPSLAFVMIGALAVTVTTFRLVLKRSAPLLDKQFFLSKRNSVDKRLIIGASLFGIGWGMSGYCPGPVVASLGFLNTDIYIMLVSIIIGFVCQKSLLNFINKQN